MFRSVNFITGWTRLIEYFCYQFTIIQIFGRTLIKVSDLYGISDSTQTEEDKIQSIIPEANSTRFHI